MRLALNFLCFFLIAPLALFGCPATNPSGAGSGGEGQKKAEMPAGPVRVSTVVVGVETYVPELDVGGTLAAWDQAEVAAEVAGRLVAVAVDLGDRVQKGAVLAQIQDEELRLVAEKATIEAELAAATLKRLETLALSQSVTEQELDKARADAGRAQSDAALARKRLMDATVRAPTSGVISDRLASVGDYVSVWKPLVTLTVLHPLRLRLDIPASYASTIRTLSPVRLLFEHSDPMEVTISRTAPVISETNRTFVADADIDNHNYALKAGAFVRAAVPVGPMRNVASVPPSCLSSSAGLTQVFEIEAGKARIRTVSILKQHDKVLLVDGILPNSVIASSGGARLFDGADVEPDSNSKTVNDEPAAPRNSAPTDNATKKAGGASE